MAAQSVRLAGKQFVILPKHEYTRLKQKAVQRKAGKPKTPKGSTGPGGAYLPPIESYSDERVAEFLLSNSVDAEDYARACEEVRRMGLDPAKIRHYKPAGVA